MDKTVIVRISTKRVYESISPEDGFCILVDRLWPRGVSKSDLRGVIWFKEIAPSTELRKEFNHDPDRWDEFKKHYFAELESSPVLVSEFKQLVSKEKILTLLYSARDTQHNQAVALKEYLESSIK